MKQIRNLDTKEIILLRDKNQEGDKVYRWFENEDIIASIVEGYFSNECNLRISFCWGKYKDIESIEVRGHKSIMLNRNDEDILNHIKRIIERHIKFNEVLK